MSKPINQLNKEFDLQKREFDAVEELCFRYRIITLTSIVDDDYPEVRHRYEGAMRDLISILRANGRIP